MSSKFIPNSEDLMKTDFRNPRIDKTNKKHVFLLLACVAMLGMIFLPWFRVGVEISSSTNGMGGSIMLRTFGFQAWYGIVAGVLALIAIIGVLYRHIALSMWASIVAVAIGVFALNTYPSSRLVIDLNDKAEKFMTANNEELKKVMDLPNFQVPGIVSQAVAVVVETVDQDFVYEAIEEFAGDTGKEVLKTVDVINDRWGAVLYLVFAALAAVLSYLAIYSGNKKEEQPVVVEQTASDATTLV